MKDSKRILALLLAVIMLFSFAGCDLETTDYDNGSSVSSSTNSCESLNISSENEFFLNKNCKIFFEIFLFTKLK